jgi:hypothetical protein
VTPAPVARPPSQSPTPQTSGSFATSKADEIRLKLNWTKLKKELTDMLPLAVREEITSNVGLSTATVGDDTTQRLARTMDWMKDNNQLPLFVEIVAVAATEYKDRIEQKLQASPFSDFFYPRHA